MTEPARSMAMQEIDMPGAAEDLAFGRSRIDGTNGGMALPNQTRRRGGHLPRPAAGDPTPAEYRQVTGAVLADHVVEALRVIGRSVGVDAVVLAAAQVVLARYAVTDDVVVWLSGRFMGELAGVPAANDGGAAVSPVLALRWRYDEHHDIGGVLAQLREQARQAYRHNAAATGFATDADSTVRVGFAVAGDAADDTFAADLVVTCDSSSAIRLGARFRPDLFDVDAVSRLLSSVDAVLGGVAQRPDRDIGVLPMLSAAERTRIIEGSRGQSLRCPEAPLVHQWVAERAAATPTATALVSGERRLSYRELDERANQLSHDLLARGVGPDTRVALCLDRSPEMIVGMLAVLKTGAAYLPIDPGYPAQRLAFLLDDSQPTVLLVDAASGARLPDHTVPTVELEPGWARLSQLPTTAPQVSVAGQDLAYVIYTSGSTGQPKGVELRHDGLLNLIRWHHDAYRLGANDRTTHLSGIAFDASVWEIWPTLAAGATLYLADIAVQESASDLVRWLVHHAITVAFLPTPLAELVLDEQWPADCALRYLLTGGDTLHRYPPDKLPFTFVNHYGPTENTVVATAAEVPAVPANGSAYRREPPIGRPIANTAVYVLDQRMQPVPVGVPGELFIGGAGLARGYLNRADLTRERFVPDPFDGTERGLLYRTGDLACWRSDGAIDFLGRNDDQVKLRGFRVELGEIEAALRSHPQIAEAVVLLREDTPGHRRLVGYLVPRPASQLSGVQLRRWLGVTLPGYMVPTTFVEMDALPITRNGKVDRVALPVPDPTRAAAMGEYLAPRSGLEAELAALWTRLLGVAPIGAVDDFFALGGTSLAATRMVIRLRDMYRMDLALSAVFAEPTVRGLAAELERRVGNADGPPAGAPIRRTARTGRNPLTLSQSQLWLLDRLDIDGITYNVPLTIELHGALDVSALQHALTEIVARHESLRTRFLTVDGRPVQAVDEPFQVELPVVVTDQPERWIVGESRRRFDLTGGRLLRCALLRRDVDEHVLLLVVHHIAFDGWSLGVFCRELGEGYTRQLRGATSPWAPPPVQPVDVAAWQRGHLDAQTLAAEVAYWREALVGLPPAAELPADFPPPARPTDEGARTVLMLDRQLTEQISAFSRAEGVTVFMTLLAALQVLLSRYCGVDDVVVGAPIAGRTRPELEGLIGCFINTLPLRTDLSGQPSFRELLGRVRRVALGAYEHQNLSFEQIIEAVRPDRASSRTPIHRVVFALEDAHDAEFTFAGVRARVTEVDFGRARSDLGLSVTPVAGELRACLEYRTELFTETTARRMLAAYSTLVAAATADSGWPVATLPLLPPAALHQMLVEWNDTASDYPRDACLHELVEWQVDATPDAPAVVFEDEASLTYRELDERANRLAHHLRGLGVDASNRVAVFLRRSPTMIVAVLAVLKAGAAYVPLDPANPADRLAFMISDADVPVVLTESELRGRLPLSDATMVDLDRDWPVVARQPATRAPRVAGPHDLAYVIYTSGSTGRPKGVLVEHHSACNFITSVHRLFAMGSHDDMLQFASLGFDVSVFEIFSVLAVGGRLHLARQETLLSVRDLTQFMQSHRISIMDMPPAVMSLLDGDAFPDLRTTFVGCEAYPGSLVNSWVRPGRRFVNGYGPTEATCTVIVEECHGNDWTQSPPIGRPMWNMLAYVLDSNEQPVPPGVAGELHIGGVCVARGYLNQPELTASRFIPNPFLDDPAERLYKTGDLVRQLPDGRLVFLGRIDNQVKLRGHRIELGEIEVALRRHPQVREAVVALREDTSGQRRLVGYVVCQDGYQPPPAELPAYLAQSLPPYMVPAAIVVVDKFPLNRSGKVDRAALAAPDMTVFAAANPSAGPRNRRERTLVEIWARLLGNDRVGIHDDFFALGGHSLLGVQMVWEVHKAFGVELSIRDIFDRPTIAELVEVVEAEMLALLDRPGGASAAPDAPESGDGQGSVGTQGKG